MYYTAMEKKSKNLCNTVNVSRSTDNDSSNNDLLNRRHTAIDQLHRMDLEALKTHNVDMLVALFTEDCIMLPPALSPLCGRDAIRSYLTDKLIEWEIYEIASYDQHFEEVKVVGDMAYEWGTSKGVYYMKNDGQNIFENSRMFRILRSQPDGSWKIARVIWHDVL
jgi:uncharacterized protein (TIGR02246 family)